MSGGRGGADVATPGLTDAALPPPLGDPHTNGPIRERLRPVTQGEGGERRPRSWVWWVHVLDLTIIAVVLLAAVTAFSLEVFSVRTSERVLSALGVVILAGCAAETASFVIRKAVIGKRFRSQR